MGQERRDGFQPGIEANTFRAVVAFGLFALPPLISRSGFE